MSVKRRKSTSDVCGLAFNSRLDFAHRKLCSKKMKSKIVKAPSICFNGSSCLQIPFVRVKKQGSHIRHLHWLHIPLLVVLLSGQALCTETTASPLSIPSTNEQTSVSYHVVVTVDVSGEKDESEITTWLEEVFRNDLQSCTSLNHEETTATPTDPQTSSASTTYETTLMMTATTTLQSFATTANTTLQSYNTTTAAATTLKRNHTTTAATSTGLKNSITATLETTVLKTTSTTSPATSTAPKTTTTSPATTTASKTTTTSPATTTASKTTTTSPATTKASKTTTTTSLATTTASKTTTTSPATTKASKTTTTTSPATTKASKTTMTTTVTKTTTSPATRTAPKTTALKSIKKTTSPVPVVITQTFDNEGENIPTRKPLPDQANKGRVAREVRDSVTQNSAITNDNPTGLFQEIEVSCAAKTAIRKTNCYVTLHLRRSISSCCILRTLCAASKASSDIHVVGKSADRINPLQNECNSNLQKENRCIYTGQAGTLCEESGAAYMVPQSNSTHCGTGELDKNNTCSCSAYCSGTDAYYTFDIFIQDSNINLTYVSSLISKLKQPNCPSSAEVPCPLATIAALYKGANVECGLTESRLLSCQVILGFSHEVPICNVSAAVMNVFQSEKEIIYNGQVIRAAICGDSEVSDNPLKSKFAWFRVNLKPASFCPEFEESYILTCQNGKNILVQMDEQCDQGLFTTPSPHVTTAQPNTTTPSVNVTSSPLNTTATIQPDTTTPSVNVTSSSLNTTATIQPDTTTPSVNVTSSSLNTTATTQPDTTTPSVNVTSSSLNTTATALTTTTITITAANVTESAEGQANALLDLTRDVSSLNSSQVNQLVSQLENLLAGPTVSLALGNTSVNIVSNLLGASPEVLSDSSNRIIGIVDTVGLKLIIGDEPQTLLSPAVALSVKPADGSNFQETFFTISDPSNVEVRGDPRLKRSVRTDSPIPQGSIRLPPTLTQSLTSEQQQQVSRVQFNFYQESTVYQDRSLGERKLNSGILGASVANLSIKELQDDVVIHLRNTEPIPANFVATCVFWDFTRNDGSGGWNPRGCSVRNSTDNETICGCNHLTSFAILLDLAREPLTSRVQATILTFITYIGCGISAIFLSVTLLTYLSFGKLRKDIPSKILIQLCLALLLLNLVFLVDAWLALYPDAVGLCISTAWFLHYFLLVTFTWMGLEAVHMYQALVKVFNSHISRFMLKFSAVGWGVPMIVVIIVIAVDKDNYGLVSYGRFSDGTSDEFCWLKNDIAFYVAVVAYFCVIFLFNVAMFVVVMVQLCRIKRQNPHNSQHRTTLQDMRSVAGITVLLGLTWGFAFFAWGPVNLAFMYLFAIFNSLQGFFIFLFYCALKENVRRQWRTYLCCGKMRLAENSEWSRTMTQKTVKKSSMTKLTSFHSSRSSQSNNSSSSSSFLVSDSSEHINGIGSPFEDRKITADEDPSMDVVLNEINSQFRNQQAH